MQIRDAEKLIITMLCDIQEQQGIDSDNSQSGIDPKFVRDAISHDYGWALEWEYPMLFSQNEEPPPVVKEVVDYLDMWSFIEEGYIALTQEEKIQADELRFGCKFPGFDGNNEGEYLGVAHFMVERLNRFERFAGRIVNSHHQTLNSHKEIFVKFKPMRENLGVGKLTLQSLTALLG